MDELVGRIDMVEVCVNTGDARQRPYTDLGVT